MSTEIEKTVKPEVPDTTQETAEEVKPDVESEADTRERVEWPGAKGEGELRLHFFDLVGMPETLEDETDDTRRLMLALIAEIQQLRIDNYDLKAAVQYMSLETFIQQRGGKSSVVNRPPPPAMHRIVSSAK